MNERRARRTVTRQEAGGRRPLTTAVFTPITGEPFPLFPAVSSSRESGMGHPDAVRPPPAVSPVDDRVRAAHSEHWGGYAMIEEKVIASWKYKKGSLDAK